MNKRRYSIIKPKEIGSSPMGSLLFIMLFDRLGVTENEVNEILDLQPNQTFTSKDKSIEIKRLK